jgi:ATP-dependent Zn protease
MNCGIGKRFLKTGGLRKSSIRVGFFNGKWAGVRISKKENKMKKYKVTFVDCIEASTEEEAYEEMLNYLKEVCKYRDLTAFDFKEESK